MKKNLICLSFFSIVGILFLASFTQAFSGYPEFETIGSDNTISDDTNDLYQSDGSDFSFATQQVPWLDIINITFSETGGNYTITMTLNGNYNPNSTIQLFIELNGSEEIGYYSNDMQLTMTGEDTSHVQCASFLGIYSEWDIASVSGAEISWTFPKVNITNLIATTKSISEWRVLAITNGESDSISYNDLAPNFKIVPLPEIPGYPIFLLGLILCISILIVVRKIHNK